MMSENDYQFDDWGFTPLSTVAEVIMGQSPDSQHVNDEQLGVPFLQGNGEFTTKYPKPIHWVTRPGKQAKRGDILISVRAPVGELNISDREYCIGRGLAAIRFKNTIGRVFGWYCINYCRNQLYRVAQGSTFLAVSSNDIKNIKIPQPEEMEQRKIAEILTTIDDAIEQTEALIRKYQRIKQGLMHDLLTRGVDENGELRQIEKLTPVLYAQTPGEWIPKEWPIKTIENLSIHVGSGITPKGGSQVYSTEGVLFIRSQNVTFDGLLLDDVAYIDEKLHRSMSRSEIFPFDVLINITGASIGRCCVFPDGLSRSNVNQHVCAIRLLSPNYYDAHYLSYVLSSWIGQSQIDTLNAGGNRQGLNYQQLRSFKIPWPGDNERKRIVKILQNIDEAILIEKQNFSKLISQKKGLMQDLLTGGVRVHYECSI